MTVDTMTDPPGAADLRERLADQLAATGAIRSPLWRAAFAMVPRHVFVPEFSARTAPGEYQQLGGADPARRQAWLEGVYSDDSLVTQRDVTGNATSSSSQPAVMARMLEALDVRNGVTVLEVGTGTGYNAGLLCHRLGDTLVTSVDIDQALVDQARDRLAAIGYSPTLAAGDGLAGYPPRAPYDRIIGTCATHRIPTEWLIQTRPGGVIVTCVGHGAVPLIVGEDGSAVGRFEPETAIFMPARAGSIGPALSTADQFDLIGRDGYRRPTGLFADVFDQEFVFVTAAATPNLSLMWSTEDQWYAVVDGPTRSWARAHAGTEGATVTQGGPRHLWDEFEDAHAWWVQAGRPVHDRLGLTITPNGAHTLWVDAPGQQDYGLV